MYGNVAAGESLHTWLRNMRVMPSSPMLDKERKGSLARRVMPSGKAASAAISSSLSLTAHQHMIIARICHSQNLPFDCYSHGLHDQQYIMLEADDLKETALVLSGCCSTDVAMLRIWFPG